MRISSDSSVARLKALALKNFWIISGIISFHASRIQFITARQDRPFKFPVEVSWLIPFSASYLSYFFVAIALTLSCRRSSLYRNQPLICRANQCNSLYMIGISVMKKLKGLFRLTSGECIDLVNPLRRIETILFFAWSNNFALSLIRHWFELHTRWWRRNENAPITWFTHVWVNSEFIQAFGDEARKQLLIPFSNVAVSRFAHLNTMEGGVLCYLLLIQGKLKHEFFYLFVLVFTVTVF